MNATTTSTELNRRLRRDIRPTRSSLVVDVEISVLASLLGDRTTFSSIASQSAVQRLASQDGELSGQSFKVSPRKGRDHYPPKIRNSLLTPLHTALAFRLLDRHAVSSARGLNFPGFCLRQPLELVGPRLVPVSLPLLQVRSKQDGGPAAPASKSGRGMPPGKGV